MPYSYTVTPTVQFFSVGTQTSTAVSFSTVAQNFQFATLSTQPVSLYFNGSANPYTVAANTTLTLNNYSINTFTVANGTGNMCPAQLLAGVVNV